VNPEIEYTVNPNLSFEGKNFCFAGKFDGRERSELEHYVKSKGAAHTPNVSPKTDFLVIGSVAIRCCSFSCCVRVVEKAVELKAGGAPLQLIREADFLDVMETGHG
jgi:NAD-dependent DNA ligase